MEEYGVKREELFVSTKLWNDHRGYDLTMEAFENSMKELGLEYLDLYMIHWPAVERWHEDWREINRSTWKAFEELYRAGRIKAIGVSNFLAHHVQAWSPFGTGDVLKNVTLSEIAGKYGKITAQICLRWLVQKNIVPLAFSISSFDATACVS